MKWEKSATLHSEDKLFAVVNDSKSYCNGTNSMKCSITQLAAQTEYAICLLVCHPDPEAKLKLSKVNILGGSFLIPTISSEDFYLEFKLSGLFCVTNSCRTTTTLTAGENASIFVVYNGKNMTSFIS